MEEVAGIIVWLLVLIIVFAILYYAGVNWWTNITLSLFIAWIFLLGIFWSCHGGRGDDCCYYGCRDDHVHKSKRGGNKGGGVLWGFFGVVTFITIVIFIAYLICQAIWNNHYVPLVAVTQICHEDNGRLHKMEGKMLNETTPMAGNSGNPHNYMY